MSERTVAEIVTCPRCGSEAPWIDRANDEHVEAVLQAAVAVCGRRATPNELDVLRAAVAVLTADSNSSPDVATSQSAPSDAAQQTFP